MAAIPHHSFPGHIPHRLKLFIAGLIAFLVAWLWARPME